MNTSKRKSYYRVAYILMIFATVFWGLTTVIGLAWAIPMTLKAKSAYNNTGDKNEEKSHTALGVWSFFMMGILPSVFILLASNTFKALDLKEEYQRRNMLYRTGYQFMAIATGLIGLVSLIMICSMVGLLYFWIPLIALAWAIPMTLKTKKAMKNVGTDDEKKHTALAVCSIIFVNLIPGIITLFGTSEYQSINALKTKKESSNVKELDKTTSRISKKETLLKIIPLVGSLFTFVIILIVGLLETQWKVDISSVNVAYEDWNDDLGKNVWGTEIINNLSYYVYSDIFDISSQFVCWILAVILTGAAFVVSIAFIAINKAKQSRALLISWTSIFAAGFVFAEILLILIATDSSSSWGLYELKNPYVTDHMEYGDVYNLPYQISGQIQNIISNKEGKYEYVVGYLSINWNAEIDSTDIAWKEVAVNILGLGTLLGTTLPLRKMFKKAN